MALGFKDSGSNNGINVGNVTSLDGKSACSVMGWALLDGAMSDVRIISRTTGTAVSNHMWMLGIDSNGIKYRLKIAGTTRAYTDTQSLSSGVWYHFCFTYNGSAMKSYLDAVEKGSHSHTGTISSSSHSTGIGNQPSGTGNRCWDGPIFDVRLYDRAVSIAELTTIHALRGRDRIFSGMTNRWILREFAPGVAPIANGVKDYKGVYDGSPYGSNLAYRVSPFTVAGG